MFETEPYIDAPEAMLMVMWLIFKVHENRDFPSDAEPFLNAAYCILHNCRENMLNQKRTAK